MARSEGRRAGRPPRRASRPPLLAQPWTKTSCSLGLVVPIDVCLRDDDQVRPGEARHRVPGHDILKKGYQPLSVLLREEGDGCAFLAGSNLLLTELIHPVCDRKRV